MRVVVLGATGTIGSPLVRALERSGGRCGYAALGRNSEAANRDSGTDVVRFLAGVCGAPAAMNQTVARNDRIRELVPFALTSFNDAARAALQARGGGAK